MHTYTHTYTHTHTHKHVRTHTRLVSTLSLSHTHTHTHTHIHMQAYEPYACMCMCVCVCVCARVPSMHTSMKWHVFTNMMPWHLDGVTFIHEWHLFTNDIYSRMTSVHEWHLFTNDIYSRMKSIHEWHLFTNYIYSRTTPIHKYHAVTSISFVNTCPSNHICSRTTSIHERHRFTYMMPWHLLASWIHVVRMTSHESHLFTNDIYSRMTSIIFVNTCRSNRISRTTSIHEYIQCHSHACLWHVSSSSSLWYQRCAVVCVCVCVWHDSSTCSLRYQRCGDDPTACQWHCARMPRTLLQNIVSFIGLFCKRDM